MSSLFALSLGGIIHDAEPLESETDHHHKIDHEHATSHQSFKIHHFHAVPVYVKHEDQHYLKNPIEVGGVKHKLKVTQIMSFFSNFEKQRKINRDKNLEKKFLKQKFNSNSNSNSGAASRNTS